LTGLIGQLNSGVLNAALACSMPNVMTSAANGNPMRRLQRAHLMAKDRKRFSTNEDYPIDLHSYVR
jgi:hypothetical protein